MPIVATAKLNTVITGIYSTLNDEEEVDDNVKLVTDERDSIEAPFRRLVSDPYPESDAYNYTSIYIK